MDPAWIAATLEEVPELPLRRRERFVSAYHLPESDAAELTKERELADFFEAVVNAGGAPKAAANWLLTELLSRVSDARGVAQSPVPPEHVAQLLDLIAKGTISGKIAKTIWSKMWESGPVGARDSGSREPLSGKR